MANPANMPWTFVKIWQWCRSFSQVIAGLQQSKWQEIAKQY